MSRDNEQPKAILREDYQQTTYEFDNVVLHFDLETNHTVVTSRIDIRRRAGADGNELVEPLVLDGLELDLRSIAIDDEVLDAGQYTVGDTSLTIHAPPSIFNLCVVTVIDPGNNTALEGLYQSSGNFCTQCEAQGFRKITYFPDRPDVLATYDVTLQGDKDKYPVLLSNGNPVGSGEAAGGKHWARWQDPFPKPSYLFALVAGRLEFISDSFVTKSGRTVELRIYVESHNISYCDYAMQSLKRAMIWDEEVYGLEYDLDIFMIVAVDDFNMGAMENKGLNVFNSKFILADIETATDTDYSGIESVVAHEYFHNWTGNRITCRDWFQLSLKEGLTVFRDQEFSSDLNSRAVNRVADVRLLRARQFPEDAGPMAHPIRPDSYIEINNFYTVTVYEKGAEVIRMLHTLLGSEKFHQGIDLYVQRHDGDAATCDDFVAAMADATGTNLDQFKNWYSQAGTPLVKTDCVYDSQHQTLTLKLSQDCPATPGQATKKPFHIPVKFALIGGDGKQVPLQLAQQGHASTATSETSSGCITELVLQLTEASQSFVFEGVETAPIPSLLRQFSAPVVLEHDYTDAELALLLAHDTDSFNRWESAQRLSKRVIKKVAASLPHAPSLSDAGVPADCEESLAAFVDSYRTLLKDETIDTAELAAMLMLPGIETIPDTDETIDIDRLHIARQWLYLQLAESNEETLLARYHSLLEESVSDSDHTALDARSMGKRALKNVCLQLLAALPEERWADLAYQQFNAARNMTDRAAALRVLCDAKGEFRQLALDAFYERFADNKLVIDKWFSMQAMSESEDVVERVVELRQHPAFTLSNPNRVRSLLGVFAMGNPVGFHRRDGAGYRLVRETVEQLDTNNPQVAARVAGAFSQWRRYDEGRQKLMKQELELLAAKEGLSADVFEIVSKSLV